MRFQPILLLRVIVIIIMGLWTACALQQAPPSKPASEAVEKVKKKKVEGPYFYLPTLALGEEREPYVSWASWDRDTKQFDVYVSRSQTAGRSWLAAVSVNPDRSQNIGGRHILAGEKGDVYALWASGLRTKGNEIVFARSEDRGASWTAPMSIHTSRKLYPPRFIRNSRGVLYAVMPEGSEIHWTLAFARSSDGGKSWETLPKLPSAQGTDTIYGIRDSSAVADDQGQIHVVWQERGNPPRERIYYNRFVPATGNGGSWLSQPIQLSMGGPDSFGAYHPKISIDREGHVFVVWVEAWNPQVPRFEGRHPQAVHFNRSMDSGTSWLPQPIQLSESGPSSIKLVATSAEVADNGKGHVYVAWRVEDGFPATERIMFARSLDYGSIWTSVPQRLYQNTPWPIIMDRLYLRAGGADNVYLLWQMVGGSDWKLLFSRSGDGGQSWLEKPLRLASLPQSYRNAHNLSLETGGPYLYVAWDGGTREPSDIFLNRSEDFGMTWLSEEVQVSRR